MKDEQYREYIKCVLDPIYCLQNFVWMDGDEGIIPFNIGTNPDEDFYYQYQTLKWLSEGKSEILLKSRRAGASWIGAFWAWYNGNFHKGWNSLFISIGGDEAVTLLKKVKFIHKNLRYKDDLNIELCRDASFLAGPTVIDNEKTFSIGHYNERGQITIQSVIKSLTTTAKSGRGEKSRFTFVDEANFIENEQEVLSSVLSTSARAGQFFMASSAGNAGTVFYNLCMKGRKLLGDKNFAFVKDDNYVYREVRPEETGISESQIKRASVGQSSEHVNKEWNLTFVHTGAKVFNPNHLDACYRPYKKFKEVREEIRKYRQLHKLNPSEYYYYSGVDTAVAKKERRKTKKDYQGFTSLTNEGLQVFGFSNQMELSDWAGKTTQTLNGFEIVPGIVSKLHAKFPGVLDIEENGPGYTTINRHMTPSDGFSYFRKINTNVATKPRLINQLQVAIESHIIVITDETTYYQLSIYEHKGNGQFGAPSGEFDDMVLALALAWNALLQEGTKSKIDLSNIKTIQIQEDASHVGIRESAFGEYPQGIMVADPDLMKELRHGYF